MQRKPPAPRSRLPLKQVVLSIALAGLSCLAPPITPAYAKAPSVVVMRVDGAIEPASLRFVERGLHTAAQDHAALVVLEIDTPGGSLVSLRAMTLAITQSEVPVVVYVAPAGARAASAGFFLLMAADVAAMAPGTNTGAAHPVSLGGGGAPPDPEHASTAITKVTEDAAALARSLAAARGRSTDWAERAVRDSLSYSVEEASSHGLIEVVARDRRALLSRLDGATLGRLDGRKQVLALRGARTVMIEPTLGERVLMVVADPQVA
jgi:membrane-bound serine protease (ClpP class)